MAVAKKKAVTKKSTTALRPEVIAAQAERGSKENPIIVPWQHDSPVLYEFYGRTPPTELKVGIPWHPLWRAPVDYTVTAKYTSDVLSNGKHYRFYDGYYYVLQAIPPPKLIVQAFPTCCGLCVVTNFGKTATGGSNVNMNAEHADKSLKEIIELNNRKVAGLIVAINHEQVRVYDEVLKKNGFKIVFDKVYHPGHGNYITTYMIEFGKKAK